MIVDMFPNLLRSIVSNTMMLIFLFTLARPKYKNKSLIFFVFVPLLFDIGLSVYFYLSQDYTNLARFSVLFIAALCLVSKPFFHETYMQWIFNFITAANAFMAIVVLSYLFSRPMPYKSFAHTGIRIVLFGALIILFYRYVRPYYRQVVRHWSLFILTSVAFFVNFSYYIMLGSNIELSMRTHRVQLLLLIILMIVAYITIFLAHRVLSKEYELREESIQAQTRGDLLRVQMNMMQERLQIMDDAERKKRISNHDRRHLDNTLLALLHRGEVEEAITCLEQTTQKHPMVTERYCENTTINAAISYYASKAKEEEISFQTKIDIPEVIPVDVLELSIVIGNLLENALHACMNLGEGKKRYIQFTFLCNKQLVFELENPYEGQLTFNEDGYPTTKVKGHGLGTKSIIAFVEKNNVQLRYSSTNNVLRVRALI